MVKDIAFTAYPAADVEALMSFYTDALGLRFADPYSEDGVAKYAEAHVGNGYFSLMTPEWMDVAPGSAAGIVFEVGDIESALSYLSGKGIQTEAIHDTPVCRLSSFHDPEGNKVTLHQATATN